MEPCAWSRSRDDIGWIEDVLSRTAAHRLVARTLTLATGAVALRDALRTETLQFDGRTLVTYFGPRWRLLLIGAGQLSQAVAQMMQLLDFEVWSVTRATNMRRP